MSYTVSYPSGVLRLDGIVIPPDASTPAFLAYCEFLKNGGTVDVLQDDTATRQRIEVSAWQIRKALNKEGLRDGVEAWVAGSSDQNLKDGYYHATTFWSDHEFALAAGAALGKDADWMYNFFLMAKSL